MRLNINYSINDIFNHSQLKQAEKNSPDYDTITKHIDKMNKYNNCDYVLFITFEESGAPFKYIKIVYETNDDITKKLLTVEYHKNFNSYDIVKKTPKEIKKEIKQYMIDNNLLD